MNGPTDASPASAPRSRRPLPWLWIGLLTTTTALGLTVATNGGAALPPGTRVAGVDLSGLTLEAARAKLEAAGLGAPQVTVRAGAHTWTVGGAQLGWRVDAPETVRQLQEQGGNALTRTLARFTASGPREAHLVVRADAPTVQRALDALTKDAVQGPTNAEIYFDGAAKRYAYKADKDGLRLDTLAAANAYAADPSLTTLELPTTLLKASFTAEAAKSVVEEGNRLMRPLTLKLQGASRTLTLTSVQVANLYWVRPSGIELDDQTILDAVNRAGRLVGQAARNARYEARAGQLVAVGEHNGLTVRRGEAVEALRWAVLHSEVTAVELPSTVAPPTLSLAELPDPASLTLIAEGSSTYTGSSPARATNVAVAARKLTGYVVPAGEDFSFLNAVGHITAENGFVGGLIISGGRTVEGLGGGVCQVSTTAFRALYSAGLPVVERNQHAYRVGYYNPQVGFEAAVYDPSLDLRMKNDTGGPMLVRAFNDPANHKLVVRLYGTAQARKVTVGPAVILSHTPAPPTQYVVNAALKSGQRRQVDWAADGYQLYITRTITDASGTRTEKLGTNYKPWRAVYEVGPTAKPAPRTADASDEG